VAYPGLMYNLACCFWPLFFPLFYYHKLSKSHILNI